MNKVGQSSIIEAIVNRNISHRLPRLFLVSNSGRANQTICRSQRFYSSPTSAITDILPDSVKEAVKSSVLDEASRHDSKLWTTDSNNDVNTSLKIQGLSQGVNGGKIQSPSSAKNGAGTNSYHDYSVEANMDMSVSSTTTVPSLKHRDINNPISEARLQMLNDPLDEWHLHANPKFSSVENLILAYSSSTDGDNNNNGTNAALADPFKLAKSDMEDLSKGIRIDLIASDHPVLAKAASYFFEKGQEGGKKVRPMMVLLLSRAMASGHQMDISQVENNNTGLFQSYDQPMPKPLPWQRQDLPQAQRRLAEISEMIHTASLFHDDVIDDADTRRGAPSVHKIFGNKMAILAGDYLLARASIFLARLRDVEVVETMSTIIEHLVRGEVMQMKGTGGGRASLNNDRLVYYLRKNFYKTASLMANSCKSAAILGGYNDKVISAAYKYGKHVGIAFQLIDDVLDFDGNTNALGKPLLADLNAGLATAPVLYAAEKYPNELQIMMDRKFVDDGDVEATVRLVRDTNGIQRTKDLAMVHAELAIEALMEIGPSVYRDSLIHLACKVVKRSN